MKFFKRKLAYIMEEDCIDMDMEENKGRCKKQMTDQMCNQIQTFNDKSGAIED